MGFHKRFITKQHIIDNIHNIDYYLRADALIFDSWSSNFYEDMNPEERPLRDEIKRKMFEDGGCADKHHGYDKLVSFSECLISLMTDPNWLDVHFVKDKLGFELTLEEMGNFEIQRQKSIEAIINYFENESQ